MVFKRLEAWESMPTCSVGFEIIESNDRIDNTALAQGLGAVFE
jgi:hypothetical protein